MIVEDTHEHVVEEENYFVSMTDMMVGLIFIFIILLMYYALQFRDVTDQLAGADQTRTEVLEQLQRSLRQRGVIVDIDPDNGVLRLPNAILFDSARAELKPDGRIAVGHLAEVLAAILPCYTDGRPRAPTCPDARHRIESVYVEGHTDRNAMAGGGLLRDNWDLSVVRATNTYRALIEAQEPLRNLCTQRGGECEPVLSVSGYGPQRPVDRAATLAADQANRRIDLRLIMATPDSGSTRAAVDARLVRP